MFILFYLFIYFFQKFAPLPCWLVKRSRVYVCADSLYGDDERGVNDADQLSNEPIDVSITEKLEC